MYQGCIIANGHHWDCLYPAYAEGGKAPAFEGTLMHSKAYKEPSIFEANGKYVVVGGGNSACDILVDAAREGADVYWYAGQRRVAWGGMKGWELSSRLIRVAGKRSSLP